MDNARHEFDRALQLRQLDPAEIQTNDLERKAGLALSYNKMGNFFLRQDQPREALDYYLKSVTLRRELCDGAERTDWKRNLGFSLANAADRYWELKEYAPSIDLTRERYDLAEALHQADPNDPELTTDYQNALKALASRLMQAPDRALQDVDRALELARSGVEYTQRRSSQMLLLLAEALRMSKRTAEAAEIAAEARRLPPAVSLSAEEAGSGRGRGAGERKNKAPEPAGGKKATRKRTGG
jgi:tetratricopeptide (TPR) repeat protein